MDALIDTNILIYRYDYRFPEKQEIATGILRRGIADGSVRLPHFPLASVPVLQMDVWEVGVADLGKLGKIGDRGRLNSRIEG